MTTDQLASELIQELKKDPISVAATIERRRQNTDEGLLIDPRTEQLCFDTWLRVFGFCFKARFQTKQPKS